MRRETPNTRKLLLLLMCGPIPVLSGSLVYNLPLWCESCLMRSKLVRIGVGGWVREKVCVGDWGVGFVCVCVCVWGGGGGGVSGEGRVLRVSVPAEEKKSQQHLWV